MNLLNPVCPLLATQWFMRAYKLLSIRSLYVVWAQVSKTNKYMPNFKQMSCFRGKGFCENLELHFFCKELKQIHYFQMSLLTESKHPDIWICWYTILRSNQMKYSWFFNRNTEYLTVAEPLSAGGRSWTYSLLEFLFWRAAKHLWGQNSVSFQSSWLLQPVLQKIKKSLLSISVKDLYKNFVFSVKANNWYGSKPQACLINGIVKICRQHPTFVKSGMTRTTAVAFLAWVEGVWPPTSRMFSPCMKIMQVSLTDAKESRHCSSPKI